MIASVPPALPQSKPEPDPGWKTYLGAASILFPGAIFWTFANLVLLPRVLYIWKETELENSKAQWLMDWTYGFVDSVKFVVLGVAAVTMFLELRGRTWPQHRRVAIGVITFLANTAMLTWLSMICTAGLLAVPKLSMRSENQKPPLRSPER